MMRLSCVLLFVGLSLCSLGCTRRANPSGQTVTVDEFRQTERAILATFNGLLRNQRANQIDELELANSIDRAVLPPWRMLRARIDAATPPASDRELYSVLRRYVATRQRAWEAFSAALHSPSDEAAKPLYAAYRAGEAAAVDDARILGRAFRAR